MDDNRKEWYDPLLSTDVTWQQNSSNYTQPSRLDSRDLTMPDPDSAWESSNGGSALGFSLNSHDLVICADSPNRPTDSYGYSPEFTHTKKKSFELSFENGIDDFTDTRDNYRSPCVKFLTVIQTFENYSSPESSLELLPPQEKQESSPKDISPEIPVVSVNAGSTSGAVTLDNVIFEDDNCFTGGDMISTNTIILEGEGLSLYQTARFGNFSYTFPSLESGDYIIDLHFAEIVFVEGPPGARVFDVFIQDKKVVSCLDIYAEVGANKPLVIPYLRVFVNPEEDLCIRFEGVMGSATVCGISVKRKASVDNEEAITALAQAVECDLLEDTNGCVTERGYQVLRKDYESQKKELSNIRRLLEELKKENQLKHEECQEARNSLQSLQNELMRKSIHVGSLAYAVEGQLKEKTKWFSSLRDLERKLKIMKMEQIKIYEEASVFKNHIADMGHMNSMIQSRINQQVGLHEALKIKFLEGAKENKELYNKLLELKGNIRVFCRCRPLNNDEKTAGTSVTVDFESAKDGELTLISNGAPKKTFKFDSAFGTQASQADVFEDTAPFVKSVLDGFNVCILAYGQTGTGKTFTMEGTEDDRGVNYRTLEELFHKIKERENLYRYDLSVSVLEVYNEQIRDLLISGSPTGSTAKRLEIRQVGEGIHHVPGLVEAQVKNISEVWEVFKTGSKARAVGLTNANEHSSRSHCIHCVMVKAENLLNGEWTKSKLWLVDLAGSERVTKTEVQGERLKETQNINRSLSALGDVISALAAKSSHIPFRNSKLTHLLQDSLGGDSKTLMFVQISPSENDLSETLCSLNFASRVRGIELGPARRQLENTELLRHKQMVEKSKQDMKMKEVQMKKMEETIYGLESKMKDKDLKKKSLQDKVKEMEETMNGFESKMKEKDLNKKSLQEKVKELEAQLLVERRLAHHHLDTKTADQHHEDQVLRPALASRSLRSNTNLDEQTQLPMEISYKPAAPLPPSNGFVKHIDYAEKENNHPSMAEQLKLPKTASRATICMFPRRVSAVTAPRRNSLIPPPSIPTSLPLARRMVDRGGEKENGCEPYCLPEETPNDIPKEMTSTSKILNSILRRSINKKIKIKSPIRKGGGINVGMEKVRMSIGNRGRLAQRVLLSNARRGIGAKTVQVKEKPRGWI